MGNLTKFYVDSEKKGSYSIIKQEITINIPINQLRGPAIFKENQKFYLLNAVTGENGIAIADSNINEN